MQIDFAAIAPELILVATAALVILGDAFSPRGLSRGAIMTIAIVGIVISAAAAFPLLGRTVSPFWGAITIDPFAVFFKLLFLAAAALVILASSSLLSEFARYRSEFVGLVLLATTGLMLLAAASDLILVYISIEISSLSIAFLAAWNKRDLRSTEAGLKYFLLSAMSSAILLYGMAILYGLTGTIQLGEIATRLVQAPSAALILGTSMLLAGFGFKISAVPFQMWTPDVYEGAPTAVTAFLSVASKSAGFAALIRVLVTALPAGQADWTLAIAVISLVTMTLGNIVALVQSNVKRMLAYSSIAQAGYVLVGVAALAHPGSVPAIMFYLLAYTATNLCAFIAIILISRAIGSERIADFRGLHQRAPFLAFALAISLFSLAGLPPFAGFFAKLFIFGAAAQSGLLWLVLAAVLNSAVSLYYYAQVVHDMYFMDAPEGATDLAGASRIPPTIVSLGFTIAGVLLLGVFSSTLLAIPDVAARAIGR